MKFTLAATLLLLNSSFLWGLELEGRWNVTLFSAPKNLGLQFDGDHDLISIDSAQYFESETGYLNFEANGIFSGMVGEPVSGTLSLGATGVGTTDDGMTFYFNETGDFAASVQTVAEPTTSGFIDLNCVVKAPATAQPVSVLQGRWNILSMDLPLNLNFIRDPDGDIQNVWPLNHFGVFSGQVDFDTAGGFTAVMDGTHTGTVALEANGLVTSSDFGANENYRINKSCDIMVTSFSEGLDQGDRRVFSAMLKAPATLQTHELSGHWHMLGFDTPDQLILQMDSDNPADVTGINGENHFATFSGYLDISPTGSASGQFDGPASGTVSAGTNGQVHFTSPEGSFTGYINVSKDVIMFTQTESFASPDAGFCELVILVRSVIPRTILTEQTAGLMKFRWVDDGAFVLRRSVDLLSWNTVTASGGYYEEATTSGKAFFRLEPVP